MSWFKKKKNPIDDTALEYISDDEKHKEAIELAEVDYFQEVLKSLPQHYIQYVIDSPDALRSYIHGVNVGKKVVMSVLSSIIIQISKEINKEDIKNYDNLDTLDNIEYSIANGFLPVYNDHYDTEYCSVLYNGIMPNGEVVDIDNATINQLDKWQSSITKYLSNTDPVSIPITPEYLELRMSQCSNFFNITCDKCGTPHNFTYDIPHKNFNCTLCDNELIVYTNQLFKDNTNDTIV